MLVLLIILMVIVPLVVLLVMREFIQRRDFRRRDERCSVTLQTGRYRERNIESRRDQIRDKIFSLVSYRVWLVSTR